MGSIFFSFEFIDYFVKDLHPNSGGYKKIARGVDKKTQELK